MGEWIEKEEVLKQIDRWLTTGEYKYSNATHYLNKRISSIKPGSEWISVKDRLPPVHYNVLVWCGKDKYHCHQYHLARIDKYGCWYTVDRLGGCNPILWCPLPEPPESEGEYHEKVQGIHQV